MTIPATVECGFCHGTGKVYAQGIACSRGRGGPGCQPFEVEFDCTPCKGTGQVEVDEGEECPICRCGMDWQCINLDTGRSVYWCRICLFQRVLK